MFGPCNSGATHLLYHANASTQRLRSSRIGAGEMSKTVLGALTTLPLRFEKQIILVLVVAREQRGRPRCVISSLSPSDRTPQSGDFFFELVNGAAGSGG